MTEFQLKRVKRLALKSIINWIIQVIGRKWMTDVSHMNSNLMGTSRFKVNLKKRKVVFCFQALIMSNSRFAVLKINVAFNHRIGHTADWRSNCTAFMSDSLNNGEIGAANLPVSHLDGKDSGAERVFCKNQCP